MNYFITGASGFIGRFLLSELVARPNAQIYVLLRGASYPRFATKLVRFGSTARRIHIVEGDITVEGLVTERGLRALPDTIDHVFHLAAVYDMGMSDEVAREVNERGTRNVVDFVNRLGGEVRFHHVSSVAVAGPHLVGPFLEDHFDRGQSLEHPYYRSKFDAERIVRECCRVPVRIYRPGIVVGHSRTGEIDKFDGPYYFFDAVRRFVPFLPKRLPLLVIEGGRLPIVPVDYVVRAIDVIAHRPELDGKTFGLVSPEPPSVGELVAQLVRLAGGPVVHRIRFPPLARLANRFVACATRFVPDWLARAVSRWTSVPTSVFGQLFSQTRFDDRNTRDALAGSDVRCPAFEEFAPAMWAGWERAERRAEVAARPSDPELRC